MKELKRLYEGNVAPEEIDDLGHMNVRYYGERALQATETLMASHGLDTASCEAAGLYLDVSDIYTRHLREQLVGAPLAVLGGALEASKDRIRAYHQLINTETEEVAATFVHRIGLRDLSTRIELAIPAPARKSLAEDLVAWPEIGRPRSIDLDKLAPALSLAEARRRDMGHREEREILAEECDASGFMTASQRQNMVWGGVAIPPNTNGPPILELADGGRMSMAALETRGMLVASPRVGTRIQSFAAVVEIGRKTKVRRAWVFDVDREELIFSSIYVDVALHLGERRAIEIPDEIRSRFEARAQLDLR